mmetsp:Transcript_87853/g.137568  ORF Transcript_87853/g.137568 Transcript_87853/m.137568 type:complete len:366 (-) Transcript_87853:52-1149(-)
MVLERERSPRRGIPGLNSIPLGDFLLQRGILDERSVDYLKKAPIALASEVLLSLGPEVRNPSAFVTNKLKPYLGSARDAAPGLAPPWQDRGGISLSSTAAPVESPWRPPRDVDSDEFIVHCNGEPLTITWTKQHTVVGELVSAGILDEGSADFLMQAPEPVAKDIVACLGPDVRNPSAFVTRKLKELRANGMLSQPSSADPDYSETIMVHHNGQSIPIEWSTKEQAIADLQNLSVLDDGSADFLMKASSSLAKDIISSLGPDVRNPSAFVTRRCKELLKNGGELAYSPVPVSVVTVFHDGVGHPIEWRSRESALDQLMSRGILDERSADFLTKLSENAAWDIVSRLGPDVRNPSAFVTREAKKMV